MHRDTSIFCASSNAALNRAIAVAKYNFPVHYIALAFHEAT